MLKHFGILLSVMLLMNLYANAVQASCQGLVKCTGKDQYGVCNPPLLDAQGCGGANTESECASTETTFADDCENDDYCAIGGCTWVPVCGDGNCDSGESCLADCGSLPTLPPPPPGCDPDGWTNVGCGAGACSSSEMRQSQTYSSPLGCSPTEYRCQFDASCSPGVMACHFSVTPPAILFNGAPSTLTSAAMSIVPDVGTISNVTFSSLNPAVATLTASDNVAPYTTTATSLAGSTGQSTSYVVTAEMSDGIGQCIASGGIGVNNPVSWVQAGSGDIISAGGNINDPIPATCVGPGCLPFMNLDPPPNSPGDRRGTIVASSFNL